MTPPPQMEEQDAAAQKRPKGCTDGCGKDKATRTEEGQKTDGSSADNSEVELPKIVNR